MTPSAGHMSEARPVLADTAYAVRAWDSPQPISIRIRPDLVSALRKSIQRNLAALAPRCEELDRSLSDDLRCHCGYAASKIHRRFPISFASDAIVSCHPVAALSEPAPRICHAPIAESGLTLRESLLLDRPMLAVGNVSVPALRELLSGQDTTHLTPGEGISRMTPSGSGRPAADSFSTWIAEHDERERSRIGTIVLSRVAGPADVDLLLHRLHSHHRVLVESGSAALTWLLAQWDGRIVRHGDVFTFAEPGELFHEPTARPYISSGVEWPRISVVTISYNQRDYLEQCLGSVLNQRYPNLEFIVIDAESTDGSIDILHRYESQINHLVIEPDEGQSDALNKGFKLATGEILTWVNSDDMLAPGALKRAALAFAKSGADLVAGTCSRIEGVDARLLYRHHSALPAGKRVPFDLSGPSNWCEAWEKADYFFQPEVFFTRDIWERAGGFIKRHLYWANDWDLWLRCALAGATVVRIPDVLGISRVHSAQKTTSNEMYLWQVTNILREYDDLLAYLEGEAVTA